MSVPVDIVQYQAEDYAVNPCQTCGQRFDVREDIVDTTEDIYDVTDEDAARADGQELVWICGCLAPNPMYPHNCDCGEDPCITAYSFGEGPVGHGPCPSTGAPW